ncbi:hypothetical protein [Amycolatopsis minnesotensis]|uniref:Uncharacterized protein n=1 Tax=Amycolatopsis minnesotensis TaxID=337894 RepID=A0ABP5C5C4_9PSEU
MALAANAAHHLVDRIVYVSAFCCTARKSPLDYVLGPENKDSRGLAAALSSAELSTPKATMIFGCQPVESASVNLEDARGDPATWGPIPRSYIRLTSDRFNTLPNQDRMIADADVATPGNRFDVHDLDTSHTGFVLDADRITAILDRIAEQPHDHQVHKLSRPSPKRPRRCDQASGQATERASSEKDSPPRFSARRGRR